MNWLVFAIIAAILFGVSPLFMKSGMRKTNPYVGATVWATALLIAALIVAAKNHAIGSLDGMGGLRLLFLLLSGISLGGCIIFLFKALKTGEAMRVVPVLLTEYFVYYFLKRLLERQLPGVMRILSLVVVIISLVLILKGGKRGKNNWIAFSFLSLIFGILSKYLYEYHVGGMSLYFKRVCLLLIVAVMAWIIAFATGSVRTIRNMSFLEGIYLIASVLLLWAGNEMAQRSGSLVSYQMLLFASLVALLIFACVFLKEKITTGYVIGIVLLEFVAALWLSYIPVLSAML